MIVVQCVCFLTINAKAVALILSMDMLFGGIAGEQDMAGSQGIDAAVAPTLRVRAMYMKGELKYIFGKTK